MAKNRLVLLALCSALSMVAFSCGGGSEEEGEGGEGRGSGTSTATANITADKLPTVSVQQSDLPPGYQPKAGFPKLLSSVSECVNALAPGSDAAITQLQPLGLEGCYSSVFTKARGSDSNSPGSGSYRFRDADGAAKALPVLRSVGIQSLKPTGAARLDSTRDVLVTGLGDQSEPGVTTTLSVGPTRKFAITLYFWRSGNVVVYAGGGDSLGDLNEKAYLELSKKVASRAGA
ncbi:MAG: hypothetical protein M3N28_07225 [Actinomycetota bacterium]|nr:hypothetical protein [Actinomycetota bacterium]